MKDIKRRTLAISIDPDDMQYLKQVAVKYGLAGDSAAVRFIINAFREKQKKIKEVK